MHRGYVKAWRKIEDWPLYRDSEVFHLFFHLLFKASRLPRVTYCGGVKIDLKPGQLITGRKKLAAETGINESKVNRILNLLKSEQQIEQQTNSKFSIISIVNWQSYQESEQQIEQQMNSKRTANEQQMNTIQEVKEVKNEKKEPKTLYAVKPLVCPHFLTFWSLYPKRVSKGAAEKAWKKIKEPAKTVEIIRATLEWQKKTDEWTKKNGTYIPYPATYLNAKGWEDEQPRQESSQDDKWERIAAGFANP